MKDSPPRHSDHVLLQKIARRDSDALMVFYDKHSTLLYSIALNLMKNESAAEQVMLAAFREIWKTAAAFDPESDHPSSWGISILQGAAMEHGRCAR